jgi:apolipoprotein N-acyltransferase
MLARLLIAALAGCALTFSFAPFYFYPLAFFSVGVLAYLWMLETPKEAFWSGWAYGIGFFGSSTYWVYISIHYFGNAPVVIALIVTILFVLFLAFLFFALLGVFTSYLIHHNHLRAMLNRSCATKNAGSIRKRRWIPRLCRGTTAEGNLHGYSIPSLFIFPACWVLGEFWRTYILTGFPWALLGYSQMHSPLRSLAPIIGVYGISYITALIASILIVLGSHATSFAKKNVGIALMIIIFVAAFSFQGVQWTRASGPSINVSLIQGNIDQNHKWDLEYLIKILETYKNLSASQWTSKLIVWPEAAVPTFPEEVPKFIAFLNENAKANHSNLLFGVPFQNTLTKQYYNGMMMVGENQGVYEKVHLVPFGEYLPLKFLFAWFYHYFQVPMSSASAGPRYQEPLKMDGFKIAPFICYEIIYPWRVLRDTIGRQLIISISDDSWFGNSIALDQHQQMAQMRALETGRYLLLGANTGITAIIDPRGRVIKKAPQDQEYVLAGEILPMSGKTPLMFWQYYPILLLALFSILASLIRVRLKM